MVGITTSGKLRHPIIIQKNTPTKDGRGEQTDVWATYLSPRADIEPLTGSAFYSSDGELTKHINVFKIRYSPQSKLVNSDEYQVLYDSEEWDIESVIEVNERRRWIHIRAVRRD